LQAKEDQAHLRVIGQELHSANPIMDDALKAVGYKDDPQTKVPTGAVLTLAILAAMELGGKHNKALVWKRFHTAQSHALDTFPIPVCENIRAPSSPVAPGKVYRGYIPSKRVFFHGYQLHLPADDGRFICEAHLTPESFHWR